jgi:hypothetical protein
MTLELFLLFLMVIIFGVFVTWVNSIAADKLLKALTGALIYFLVFSEFYLLVVAFRILFFK